MRVFPFDAVVGQDDAKLALRLAAVDPRIGGVLLRGQKGSAKTTLARGFAALMGDVPFVELPLGATEDRVVGTLDTRAALVGGEVRFQPGLLAAADGGVLYVDEINLLADHLVDVLLDVAVSGENVVERDGISHRHPARFVLVGSMNPEEGELRPQLLDRFGLCVELRAPADVPSRVESVRRRLAFDAQTATSGLSSGSASAAQPATPLLSGPGAVASGERGDVGGSGRGAVSASVTPDGTAEHGMTERDRPSQVEPARLTDDVLVAASRLAVEVGAEGLRADLVLCRASAARATLDGRDEATLDDLRRVAPLALAHRSRRGPFDPPLLPPDELDRALQQTLGPPGPDTQPDNDHADTSHDDGDAPGENEAPRGHDARASSEPGAGTGSADGLGDDARNRDRGADADPTDGGSTPEQRTEHAASAESRQSVDAPSSDGASAIDDPDTASQPPSADHVSRRPSGERPMPAGVVRHVPVPPPARGASARGRAVGDAPAGPGAQVAVVPTVRAVAARRAADPEASIEASDLRTAVRSAVRPRTIVLCVDLSGSMGAPERAAAASGTAVGLLGDAYERRDRVALVGFRGDGAEVLVSPTASVEVARNRLDRLATGGETPLAAGIVTGLDVAESSRHGEADAVIVLLTDGRATGARDALDRAIAAAGEVRRRDVPALVLDCETGPTRLGLAGRIAEAMGARHIAVTDLDPAHLTHTIRDMT